MYIIIKKNMKRWILLVFTTQCILSFYLTRDETGYTITRTNTHNNMTITINCGGYVPDDPPMGH